ncbi:MAG: hypothetical protein H7833_17595 [Magnetococcus sp. DMHC-1]|nr:hypothetical protein [Magnetococcales bacterium]
MIKVNRFNDVARDTLDEWNFFLVQSTYGIGKLEGFQEGRQAGLRDGIILMLTRQLQSRFGQVPAWAVEKMARAELAVLEEWSLRISVAGSLDEVFADRV